MANMLYKSITPQHDINEPHLEFLSILVAGLLVNFVRGEVYLRLHYVIKFVSDLRQFSRLFSPNIAKILLKMALNTIAITHEPHLEFLSILVAGLLVNFLYTTDTHANNCFVSLSPRRIPGYNFYIYYPLQGTIPEKRTYVEQDERIKCTIQLLMSHAMARTSYI
jgi:hypothetical protein